MRILIITVAIVFSVLTPLVTVQAAKVRVRSKQSRQTAKSAGKAYSSVRLSRPTHSIVVTFLNLDKVNRIEYTLSYVAGGIPQGVVGSLPAGGETSQTRDFYFGTCSHGVCTAHYNIRNATFTVATRLKSGGTYVKRYRIKI